MRRLWLVIIAICIACGNERALPADGQTASPPDSPPPPPPAGEALSGSRIKVRAYTTDDGFKAPQSWYDAELQTLCSWTNTSDGIRCIPTSATFPSLYFLDTACTQPVVLVSTAPCAGTPPIASTPYVGMAQTLACGSQVTAVYAARRVATTQIYSRSAGGCAPSTAAGLEVYVADTQVALSSFVEATTSTETGSGRYAHRYWIGEDGSRVNVGVQDTVLDTICTVSDVAGGARCLPPSLGQAAFFSDAGCQSPLISSNTTSCAISQLVTISDTSGKPRAYRRGPAVSSTSAFSLSNGTCMPTTLPSLAFAQVSSEITLPVFAPVPPPTHTRLSSGAFSFEGFTETLLLTATGVLSTHDTKLDMDCTFRLRGADGLHRCLPMPFLAAGSAYTDANCTTPISVANSLGPTGTPTRFVITREPLACSDYGPPFLAHAYPLTTPITVPLYAYGANGCTALASTAGFYALGPEEPPTSFQRVDVTVDP